MDTFEEEEAIDLAVVAEELRKVDQSIAEVDQLILSFCNELGIDAPL